MVGVGALGDVPGAFVDGDHFAGVAGDAAVGEEVARVGEHEVDGGRGDLGEDVEAVALVDGYRSQAGGRRLTVEGRKEKEKKEFYTGVHRRHRGHREESR
jgi:hypothetical protein